MPVNQRSVLTGRQSVRFLRGETFTIRCRSAVYSIWDFSAQIWAVIYEWLPQWPAHYARTFYLVGVARVMAAVLLVSVSRFCTAKRLPLSTGAAKNVWGKVPRDTRIFSGLEEKNASYYAINMSRYNL